MSSIVDYDLWDQAALTDSIVKPMVRATEEGLRLGDQIAPLQTHSRMTAKLRVFEIQAFGKGQFRAPAATPPLVKFAMKWREEIIGLALLDEMEEIDEEDMRKLRSPDEDVRRSSGIELEDRGAMMRIRNERLTEVMRWAAFSGELLITYPTGDKLFVDYGFPAGHKPVASPAWSDTVNSDPLADIEAWSQKIADDSGYFGTRLHMSTKAWGYLTKNSKVQALLTYNNRAIKRPTRDEIIELMTTFAARVEPIVYDGGYRDVGSTGEFASALTRYLPENYALLTPEYVLDGTRIAETLDGPVTVAVDYNKTEVRQGEQAEVMLDHMSKTHFFRFASARLPRILVPEAFMWIKLW